MEKLSLNLALLFMHKFLFACMNMYTQLPNANSYGHRATDLCYRQIFLTLQAWGCNMQSLSDSLKYPGAHYKDCGPFACDIVKTLLILIAGKYQKEEVVFAASRPLVNSCKYLFNTPFPYLLCHIIHVIRSSLSDYNSRENL